MRMAFTCDLPSLTPINDWQETLALGPAKQAMIQRGDIVLVTGENVDDITEVMGAIVTLVTHSIYYHTLVYDHDWSFIHAFATKVFRDDIRNFYLKKINVALTWLRPRHEDPAQKLSKEGTAAVIDFATKQLGKPYDLWANLAFLFRADGIPGVPDWINKLFQNRNWLHDLNKWHCSELAGAAWYHGCGVKFVDDMKSKTYLSPADIYDSLYQSVVCTLKIQNGEYQLLTKQSNT